MNDIEKTIHDDTNKLIADAVSWWAKAQDAENRKFNERRLVLRSILQQHNITAVEAAFDGEGDSGEVQGCRYTPDNRELGKIEVPGTEGDRGYYDDAKGWSIKRRCMTLDELVDDMCYSLLSSQHPGWEINEGSHGIIRFDVATGKVKLSIAHRRVEYDENEDEF